MLLWPVKDFARLNFFYGNNHTAMGKDISGIAVSDEETLAAIRSAYDRFGYIMDPHTAVAFHALERYRASDHHAQQAGIVLSTAHPAKFLEVLEDALDQQIEIPKRLLEVLEKKKSATLISSEYSELASFLNELKQSQ